jgi:hypothetical protein
MPLLLILAVSTIQLKLLPLPLLLLLHLQAMLLPGLPRCSLGAPLPLPIIVRMGGIQLLLPL